MFLTTAENVYLGVAVGGVLTGVNAWITQRGTRRKEHRQRVWDRTVDVYSTVLLLVEGWTVVRGNVMRIFETDGPVPKAPQLDQHKLDQAQVLLDMLGDLRVREAFKNAADAHTAWGDKYRAVRDAQQQNTDNAPPSSAEREKAVARTHELRQEAELAETAAGKRYLELRSAIREVLGEAP